MSRDRIVTGAELPGDEDRGNWALRPATLNEFVGHADIAEKLSVSVEAARGREQPLEHVLFHGPPGLGKTTLAHVIANEMQAKVVTTSGPSLSRAADLVGILTNLKSGDVLFIDEIHRLPTVVEEFLYPAMEDFKIDFVTGKGAFADTIPLGLERFTLVGSTTRIGLLSAPLRDRFGIFHHLPFYPVDELQEMIRRWATLLEVPSDEDAQFEIAGRSRGTPRIAKRLLHRVRDYAEVRYDGRITKTVAVESLKALGVDDRGLDDLDRDFLRVIIEYYRGGPVGIEAIAATLNEESDTLEDVVEPFLLKIGFVRRTRQGRVAAEAAYEHLGVEERPTRPDDQSTLF